MKTPNNYLFALIFITASCNLVNSTSNVKEFFLDERYLEETPLCEITEVGSYQDITKTFTLSEDTDVQIYGVGELIWNLSDCKREQFFKSDDITLTFKVKEQTSSGETRTKLKALNFSWIDGKRDGNEVKFIKNSVLFAATAFSDSITNEKKYVTELAIPWILLNRKSASKKEPLEFDIGVGDNDDEFKQKANLRWTNSKTVNSMNEMGLITFTETTTIQRTYIAKAHFFTPEVDGNIESKWAIVPSNEMVNLYFGYVKDRYDLSSKFKACYDEDNLYLLIETNDSGRKFVYPNKILQMETFADYGWIVDNSGKTVWKMHATKTAHAGGALKNHKIDTLIRLKAGNYNLRYTSDESHAHMDWDAEPPKTSFYGIKLYNSKPRIRN